MVSCCALGVGAVGLAGWFGVVLWRFAWLVWWCCGYGCCVACLLFGSVVAAEFVCGLIFASLR